MPTVNIVFVSGHSHPIRCDTGNSLWSWFACLITRNIVKYSLSDFGYDNFFFWEKCLFTFSHCKIGFSLNLLLHLFILCVYVHGPHYIALCMKVSWKIWGNWFSSLPSSRDQTQLIRLSSKCFYLLSHIVIPGLSFSFCDFCFFKSLCNPH